MSNDKESKPVYSALEHFKASSDYAKQLTTLSTGSIVLVSTFLKDVFPNPIWLFLVVVSLISFMISVIASVVFHTLLVVGFPGTNVEVDDTYIGLAVFTSWVTFLVGLLSLVIFAARNLIG